MPKLFQIIYAIIISFHFSGIVLLGTHFMVFGDWLLSALFAILTFGIFLSVILVAESFPKPKQTFITIVILLVVTAPLFLIIPWFYKGDLFFPSKYYFYGINYLILIMASMLLYFETWIPCTLKDKDAIKAELTFWNELLRGGIFILGISMFGTIYAQSITGFLQSEEMFIITYAIGGYVLLVLSPIYFAFQKRVTRLEKLSILLRGKRTKNSRKTRK